MYSMESKRLSIAGGRVRFGFGQTYEDTVENSKLFGDLYKAICVEPK